MPKRSRRGADSMPGRVVAATSVKGWSEYLRVRAWRPLSMTKLTAKSSIAGYSSSSTARGSRWTSSMKSTSFSPRLVRMPIRSPPRSRLLSPVDLVEQILRRHDRRPAAERVGDQLRRLGRPVPELLDHDLPHELAEAVGVDGHRRGGDRLDGGPGARQGELRDLV